MAEIWMKMNFSTNRLGIHLNKSERCWVVNSFSIKSFGYKWRNLNIYVDQLVSYVGKFSTTLCLNSDKQKLFKHLKQWIRLMKSPWITHLSIILTNLQAIKKVSPPFELLQTKNCSLTGIELNNTNIPKHGDDNDKRKTCWECREKLIWNMWLRTGLKWD